jgi:hypothetical protein
MGMGESDIEMVLNERDIKTFAVVAYISRLLKIFFEYSHQI